MGNPGQPSVPFVFSVYASVSLSLSSFFFLRCITVSACLCLFKGQRTELSVCLLVPIGVCWLASLKTRSLIPACPGHLLFLSPYLGRAAFSSLLNHGCSFHDPSKFGAHDTDCISRCPGSQSTGQSGCLAQPPEGLPSPLSCGSVLGWGRGTAGPTLGNGGGCEFSATGANPENTPLKTLLILQTPWKRCS